MQLIRGLGLRDKGERVKQFSEMNEAEQKAWWYQFAYSVLEQHLGIIDSELEWLAYTHHPVFAVSLESYRWVLHLYPHSLFSWDRLDAIRYWLSRLHNDGALSVPQVGQFASGQPMIVPIKVGERSSWVNAVLMNHLEGETRDSSQVQAHEISKIGEFLGNLHQFSANNSRQINPVDFPNLNWEGLFGEKGSYPLTEEAKALFSTQQLTVMDTVAQTVKSAMDKLGQDKDEFGLIHGDFLLKNLLFHEEEVRALDFEYCGWGYYLYDLSPLLWQLKPLSNYKELEEELWQGYSSIRPLTEHHRQLLETFIAGRQVASMRWVAANQHNPAYQGKVESILQQRTAELQGFLETGILNRS
jgi:Ser/Thr protein kinase RdoA (MazF antagonist)